MPQHVRRPVVPLGEAARQRAVEPGRAHGDRGEGADHEGEKRPHDEPVPLGAQSAYAVLRRLEGGFVQWVEAVAFARPGGELTRRAALPQFLGAGATSDIQSLCGAWPGALPVEEPQTFGPVRLPGETHLVRHGFGFGCGEGGKFLRGDPYVPPSVRCPRPQLFLQLRRLSGPRKFRPLPSGVPCGIQGERGVQAGEDPDPPGKSPPDIRAGGSRQWKAARVATAKGHGLLPGRQTELCSSADQTSRHTGIESTRSMICAVRGSGRPGASGRRGRGRRHRSGHRCRLPACP